MSFSTNLQRLRASRNLTQERLAMLLGVSRQSISKWESEKAYPEMDKLLMICDLFGCTLDDLVMGDVSRTQPASPAADVTTSSSSDSSAHGSGETTGIVGGDVPGATTTIPSAPAVTAPAQDMTGYDEHCRRFSLMIPAGIAAIIWGTAVGLLFDESNSILGPSPANGFLTFLCIAVGVVIGLALMIPAGMAHVEFQRRHPFIEDFYTDEDHACATRRTAIGVTIGIGLILAAVAAMVWFDEVQGISNGWPVTLMLSLVAPGVATIVHVGMRKGLMDINDYNKEAEKERREREGEQDFYDKLIGTVCGVIMIIATIIGLVLLFAGEPVDEMDWDRGWQTGQGLFWIAWPIGAMLCGIATLVINLFRDRHNRK